MNFIDRAEPWLSDLEDDPQRDNASSKLRSTTFPASSENIAGTLDARPEAGSSIEGHLSAPPSAEDVYAARGAYQMVGLDVLAFYKSFRFRPMMPFPDEWGIFLLDAGVTGLAQEFSDVAPSVPIGELNQLAVDLLLAHERYHFWIDVWALGQEIYPLGQKLKRYKYYLAEKVAFELTDQDREESLANHYAFNKVRRNRVAGRSAGPCIRKILQRCPVPYSIFDFNESERVEGEGVLALAVANGFGPGMMDSLIQYQRRSVSIASPSVVPSSKSHPVAGDSQCPVHWVITNGYASVAAPFQGPPLNEHRRFVTAYLNGVPLRRTDHDHYRIDNGQKVKMPNTHDKDVRGYELKGTLRKAGMTHKEFRSEQSRTASWTENCPRSSVKPPLN